MDKIVDQRKPRLVFFQWDHQPNASAAGYLLLHMQQQVKCLATHFDVIVINRDCDYAEICDRYEPDLTLFESGYRSHGSQRIKIRNTNAQVPKLGLHNADPWCDRRSGFLSDMEQWGIETYFSIGTMTPEYMPELKDSLFVWPNFVDPEVYHDYGQRKIIPVTLTGQVYGLYPWRQNVFPIIRDRYPCLVSPQHTYESKLASQLLSGEAYARVLNASFVVPTCGTAGGEVVRKHFEIPGANACLLTERTPAVEAAGFSDMENCVFADQHNVVERLEYLFANPDDINRIATAGYNLVHSRHTLNHRAQIYQWFILNRSLKPGEKIVQPGPFADLIKVERISQRGSIHVVGEAGDRALLKQGDLCLEQGRVEEAKNFYVRCLDYVSYLPEAKLRLAICALRDGEADRAYDLLANLVKITTIDYGATDPDPVEWAYFLLALVCKGNLEQARRLRHFYPTLSHEELRRVCLMLEQLCRESNRPVPERQSSDRKSIHQLPKRDDHEWLLWVADILERCQKSDLASALRYVPLPVKKTREREAASRVKLNLGWRARFYLGIDALLIKMRLNKLRPNVPPLPEFEYLGRLARGLVPRSQRGKLRRIRMVLSKPTFGR
ncbi:MULTISPECIES: glycosyltransferase [unclassified Rhizobium]|uniref:glycosyltransferase n=1 Tax=unclassified Rhizobium TaxID=2613769 RepID=UPI0007EB744E|nr:MULTISPECIES: glycosyltransferase [unclassified Rhizobium]ANM13344.1 glycosyltransferase/tetratricopeptide repeat domain-containing protein [Rhizobium sp. N324]ANM19744.1 glycosyltransferase/tetratricopeptide repeat domain-containing protein [Rhizobium sp. N541]ANM26129.1 glycosyltransferase/tetratricopeptide repeat domain-containing protein [Rhizobium sp. N941]OYD01134.1 glycosyltransferase/tetratricopeptide repeat domain-containing protein [Rhizobium sp. N4311]